MATSSLEALLKRFKKDENEYKQLTELNSRFVNFITAVKEQSHTNELLESTLVQQREAYFQSVRSTNEQYYKSLSESKRLLNDLCYRLNVDLVRERHGRILADWFAKLVQFELENARAKPKSLMTTATTAADGGALNDTGAAEQHHLESNNFISECLLFNQIEDDESVIAATTAAVTVAMMVNGGGPSQQQYVSSTPDPLCMSEMLAGHFEHNLSLLSHISVSQSSLLSCGSSASFSLTPSGGSSSSGAGAGSSSSDNEAAAAVTSPGTTTASLSQPNSAMIRTSSMIQMNEEEEQQPRHRARRSATADTSDDHDYNENDREEEEEDLLNKTEEQRPEQQQEEENATKITTTTTTTTASSSSSSISQGFMSDSSVCFSLETYLTALNHTCGEMRSDCERRVNECADLRQNVDQLTQSLTSLHDSLDETRVDNLSLQESIGNLSGQIEFFKKLNMKNLGSVEESDGRPVSCADMIERDRTRKVS
jgi:hypothetical protein